MSEAAPNVIEAKMEAVPEVKAEESPADGLSLPPVSDNVQNADNSQALPETVEELKALLLEERQKQSELNQQYLVNNHLC